MTLDEHRNACIEGMAAAIAQTPWENISGWSRNAFLRKATRAFDSLNGIAFVDPIEATEEMVRAAYGPQTNIAYARTVFHAMAAAGNLTNPPEKKP